MSKKNGLARRKASDRDVRKDDSLPSRPLTEREKHIMSEITKLRPLGFKESLHHVKMMLEEDSGKPHCEVIENLMLNSYCKGYCKGFLRDYRKVIDAQLFLMARKVLKIGFLPLCEIAPILKLKKVQVEQLQGERDMGEEREWVEAVATAATQLKKTRLRSQRQRNQHADHNVSKK